MNNLFPRFFSDRLLLLEEQPGGFVVHSGAVHRPGELRFQDGTTAHVNACQPHCRLRVRFLLGQRIHRQHEADALHCFHAYALRPLPAQKARYTVTITLCLQVFPLVQHLPIDAL